MDPVTIKFAQFVAAQIFGMALAVAGIWLFLRGATGRMTLFVSGAGLKARVSNATPGALVFLIGCLLVGIAITWPSVERTTETDDVDLARPDREAKNVLDRWLSKSAEVTSEDSYGDVQDKLLGREPVRRARSEMVQTKSSQTLASLAQRKLGDRRYWRILAAINLDRGYYAFEHATESTSIPEGTWIEIWYPSRFSGTTMSTRIRVAGPAVKAGYDELLQVAQSGSRWGEDVTLGDLEQRFDEQELVVALTRAEPGGARTLRELSLKYYGEAQHWPLIAWVNRDVLGGNVSGSTSLPDSGLWVLRLRP